MCEGILITVFTPTYNRGYILDNLYESLNCQTYKHFEWIIVDDGSHDNTEEIVERWLMINKNFPINYRKVRNGGKHRAINLALQLAKGRMFFIADSDDYLANNALERIAYFESTLNIKKYAGVAGNRGYFDGQMIGQSFHGEYLDCTSLERKKHNIIGDKAEVFYTEVLKGYLFPEFENENFCTEAIVWNRIAASGYQIRWFNEIIYFTEYRSDGLSANVHKIYRNNPQSSYLYYKELAIHTISLKEKLKYLSLAIIYAFSIKKTLKDIKNELSVDYSVLFSALALSFIRKILNKY